MMLFFTRHDVLEKIILTFDKPDRPPYFYFKTTPEMVKTKKK